MSELTVLGMLGLPGAGKTTAAKSIAEERDDVQMLTMSDVAGDVFDDVYDDGISAFPEEMQEIILNSDVPAEDVVPDEDTSQALAEFADTVLGINDTFFSEIATSWVREMDVNKCVVDGIRSTADVNGFETEADSFNLLYIHTPFSVRLERLQSRGRDAESEATPEYLIDRDTQELGWGVDTILEEQQPDMFYNNFNSETNFKEQVVRYTSTHELI